jgi:carboxypeptidase D
MRVFSGPCGRRSASAGAFTAKLSTAICGILSLAMLPSLAAAEKSAADYFVHSLPGAPEGPLLKMHAG